jgi:hypothetical protein
MLGFIVLCLFAWQFSAWSTYRINSGRSVKEVFITDEAIVMNNKLVIWKTAFTRLEEVTFDYNRRVPVLSFRYTQWSGRVGPQSYTTRVPVPAGEEPIASYIVERLDQ